MRLRATAPLLPKRILRLLAFSWLIVQSPGFLSAQEAPPELAWSRTFDAGGLFDQGYDIAVDPQGFVIVSGQSFNTIGSRFTSDMIVLKYDSDGNLMWNRRFGTGGFDIGYGVDTDQAGNIYVVGHTRPNGGFGQCRAVKFDPAGNIAWNREISIGEAGVATFCYAVALDTSTNIYIAGEVPKADQNNVDAFLLKLNSDGEPIWTRFVNSAIQTVAADVAVDSKGDVVISGFSDAPTRQFMAAKFDSSGVNLFSKVFKPGLSPHESTNSPGASVAVDPANNILLGGSFVSSAGSGFLYVKASADGQPAVIRLNAMALSSITGAVSDKRGNLYTDGSVLGNLAVFKADPMGTALWSQRLLGRPSRGMGIDLDKDNNIYATGLDFNGFNFLIAKFKQAPSAPEIRLNVTLNPASVPPGGQTEVTVEARKATGEVAEDVAITIMAEPVANSGGHDHDGNRPVGAFSGPDVVVASPARGKTGPDGKLKAFYAASEFGGLETIKAEATDTPNISTSVALEVRVMDKFDNPFVALPDLSAIYIKDGGTCEHHGPTGPTGCADPDRNHFATPLTRDALIAIAAEWAETNPKLEINDISLELGGGFDAGGNWAADIVDNTPTVPNVCNTVGHCGHRNGTNADIQTFPDFNPSNLPFRDRERLRDIIRRKVTDLGGENVRIRQEGTHWHVEFIGL